MIYLDNAATAFPKAPGLGRAVADFIESSGGSAGRSTGASVAEEKVNETRCLLAQLFGCREHERVIFTSGATAAFNMLVGGLIRNGSNVIVSSMEHHALMRPLKLHNADVTVVRADCLSGEVCPGDVKRAIRPDTRLIAVTHASNVCGTVNPIKEIGKIAREHGIFFAVDAAQTAGVLDISVEENCIDFLAFAGHKGLMGPQGTGGFVISERLAEEMQPYFAGGTGSYSDLYTMPPVLPDRFEPGTFNLPGIAGLNHSIKYILSESIGRICAKEAELSGYLIERLAALPVRIIGTRELQKRVGAVSFTAIYADNRVLADRLAERGIVFRYGLHCAPSAHETLGTLSTGTIRFSVGYFNTRSDIDAVCGELEDLLL